MFIICISTIGA